MIHLESATMPAIKVEQAALSSVHPVDELELKLNEFSSIEPVRRFEFRAHYLILSVSPKGPLLSVVEHHTTG